MRVVIGAQPIWTWIPFSLVMAAVAAACFGNTTDLLLDTHDAETFRDNLAVSLDFSFFFTTDKELPSGRPLAELVKWLAYLLGGNRPAWFHLVVVILHTSASILLAVWALQVGCKRRTAFIGALFFLINVGHFRAVHAISVLDYPLAANLAFGSMVCCGRYFANRRLAWAAGWLVLLLAAMMAHLSAVVVLPLCAFWGWSLRLSPREYWGVIALAVTLQLALAGYLLAASAEETSTGQALATYVTGNFAELSVGFWRVLFALAGRTVTTAHWVPITLYDLAEWEVYVGAGVVVLLIWVITRGAMPMALYGCWTVFALIPFAILNEQIVVNVPAGPSRYLYLATAGSSMLLAHAWCLLSERFGHRREIAVAVGVGAIVLSSYLALKKTEAISLYTSARSYVARNEVETGIHQLRRAIARESNLIDLEDAYDRLCFLVIGRGDDPTEDLEVAIAKFPNNGKFQIYLEVLRSMDESETGRASAGVRLDELSELAPGNTIFIAQTYQNYGDGAYQKLRFASSIEAFRRALDFDPERLAARINLGWALITEGKSGEAAEQYQYVLSGGQNSIAHFNLGLSYLASGAYEEARLAYQTAMEVHGISEAERLGVPGHLRLLIAHGPHSKVAGEIAQSYWLGE